MKAERTGKKVDRIAADMERHGVKCEYVWGEAAQLGALLQAAR